MLMISCFSALCTHKMQRRVDTLYIADTNVFMCFMRHVYRKSSRDLLNICLRCYCFIVEQSSNEDQFVLFPMRLYFTHGWNKCWSFFKTPTPRQNDDAIFIFNLICGFSSSSAGIYSHWSNWRCIDLNNDIATDRGQAIIWNNDGLVYWRIYASNAINKSRTRRQVP